LLPEHILRSYRRTDSRPTDPPKAIMTDIPDRIQEIADQYGIEIIRDPESDRNHGANAGDIIFLGEFDDPDIEWIAFWHELAHCLAPKLVLFGRGQHMSMISSEGSAWELAIGLAYMHGYEWGYYSKELVWARQQLATYCRNEYLEELTAELDGG